jgi:hypothetical protein
MLKKPILICTVLILLAAGAGLGVVLLRGSAETDAPNPIVHAHTGPLGPNPRLFAAGVAVFLAGWGLTRVVRRG